MKRIVRRLIDAVVICYFLFFLSCSCQKQCQDQWEDGVFYGYRAAQKGATYTNYLIKAYEIKEEATKRMELEDKELSKYR